MPGGDSDCGWEYTKRAVVTQGLPDAPRGGRKVSEICFPASWQLSADGSDIQEGKFMYKNIEKQMKLQLKDLVEYRDGQVVSRTLVQNEGMGLTLFAFDKDEEISTHASGGDAMVTVLEGTGRFTVGGRVFVLEEGDTLVMPRDIPHAVYGQERFKMQLTVSF